MMRSYPANGIPDFNIRPSYPGRATADYFLAKVVESLRMWLEKIVRHRSFKMSDTTSLSSVLVQPGMSPQFALLSWSQDSNH